MISASRNPHIIDAEPLYTLRLVDDGAVRATTYDVARAIIDGSDVRFEPAGGTGVGVEIVFAVTRCSVADGGSIELQVHADGDKGFALAPVLLSSLRVSQRGAYRVPLDVAALERLSAERGYRGLWLRTAAVISGPSGSVVDYGAWIARTIGGGGG